MFKDAATYLSSVVMGENGYVERYIVAVLNQLARQC